MWDRGLRRRNQPREVSRRATPVARERNPTVPRVPARLPPDVEDEDEFEDENEMKSPRNCAIFDVSSSRTQELQNSRRTNSLAPRSASQLVCILESLSS